MYTIAEYLKGVRHTPWGTGGFGRRYGVGLKKMLIFPNCSGKECPMQKILNSTEKCLDWCHLLRRIELQAV